MSQALLSFPSSSPRRSLGGDLSEVNFGDDDEGRRCCRGSWFRWWKRGSAPKPPRAALAEVDASLVGDTDVDRLSAGVARLLYNHIAKAENDSLPDGPILAPTCSNSSSASSTSMASSSAGPSGRARGRPLLSSDFQEAQFLPKQRCLCCCPARWSCVEKALYGTEKVSANAIFRLLQTVATISEFRKEVVVIGAIYVERLLDRNPELTLSATNWRPVLVAALHLASKTWEDVHPWNAEVAAYLRSAAGVCYPARSLYLLESRFLSGLGYRVDIPGQLYASYYFSLQEGYGSPAAGDAECPSRSGGSAPNSPNLSAPAPPWLGRAKQSSTPPSPPGSRSLEAAIPDKRRPSLTLDPALSASTPAEVYVAQTPGSFGLGGRSSGGMIRAATAAGALSSMGGTSLAEMCGEDSVPNTPILPESSGLPGPELQSSNRPSYESTATGGTPSTTASTVVQSGLADASTTGSTLVRKLRRQFQLDPANPYIGSFRHAPRAKPPSAYIKPPGCSTPEAQSLTAQSFESGALSSRLSLTPRRKISTDSHDKQTHRRMSMQ